MDQLILKRANTSRPSGHWSEDDYDVLAEGEVVGRIMKVIAAPEDNAVDVDVGLWAAPRPFADTRLRGHARGCDGRLRSELASRGGGIAFRHGNHVTARPARAARSCERVSRLIVMEKIVRALVTAHNVVSVHQAQALG
jgi:hypothetical protein